MNNQNQQLQEGQGYSLPAPQDNDSRFMKCVKLAFLKKYHPIPTIRQTICLFFGVGTVFLIIGIVIVLINNSIVELKMEYEETCKQINPINQKNNFDNCKITFTPEQDLEPPIFFFYHLENFYQNHRRYMKSKSDDQLNGKQINTDKEKANCDPIIYNKDLFFAKNLKEGEQIISPYIPENTLDPTKIAYPCGLIANSFFDDKYKFEDPEIVIDETGITWPDDKGDKFRENKEIAKLYWISPEDEHFIVWMRTSGLPNFRKLWGRIKNTKLLKGKSYTIQVANNFDVIPFNGKKSIILSTSGVFGGKNGFLAGAYFSVSIICILIAVFFLYKEKKTSGAFGNKID